MSRRKDFEEFCRRTRPPMSTARELQLSGWGEYANNSTQAAWRAWQYLDKQYNPWPKGCKAVKHEQA
jgi:hypothetical protein